MVVFCVMVVVILAKYKILSCSVKKLMCGFWKTVLPDEALTSSQQREQAVEETTASAPRTTASAPRTSSGADHFVRMMYPTLGDEEDRR